MLLVIVGFGLFSLINRDVSSIAENLVRHLHMNPFSRYPHIFLDATRHITNTNLLILACLTLVDATGRGFVAYGLWGNRDWGKWLGVVMAAIYIPLEIYEIYKKLTTLKIVTLVTNVAIVVYLGLDLYFERRNHKDAAPEPPGA